MRQPLHLTARLARYLVGKRFRKEPHVPVVLMLEPLYTCNLACLGCANPLRDLEFDHVVPLGLGGANALVNALARKVNGGGQ